VALPDQTQMGPIQTHLPIHEPHDAPTNSPSRALTEEEAYGSYGVPAGNQSTRRRKVGAAADASRTLLPRSVHGSGGDEEEEEDDDIREFRCIRVHVEMGGLEGDIQEVGSFAVLLLLRLRVFFHGVHGDVRMGIPWCFDGFLMTMK